MVYSIISNQFRKHSSENQAEDAEFNPENFIMYLNLIIQIIRGASLVSRHKIFRFYIRPVGKLCYIVTEIVRLLPGYDECFILHIDQTDLCGVGYTNAVHPTAIMSELRLGDNIESSSFSDTQQTLDAHEGVICGAIVSKKRACDCRFEGCSKRRTFGPIGGIRKSAVFCGSHATDRTVYEDVNAAKCDRVGCGKTATFGEPGGKRNWCSKHHDPMVHIDLVNAKCDHDGCGKTASFGEPGGKPTWCNKHIDRTVHIDLRSAKCNSDGCTLTASFGEPGGKMKNCGTHKKQGQIYLRVKSCLHDGCIIQPCYGFLDMKPTHCVTHQIDGQLNVVQPRCVSCTIQPGKFIHPRSDVGKCRECDKTLWPRLKKQEDAFAEFITGEFVNSNEYRTFDREVLVTLTGCGMGVDRAACGMEVSQRARLDFVFDNGASCVVVVEVDEEQHKRYCVPSEIARANATVSALFLGGNHRHVRVVRFNPDAFYVDGTLRHVHMTLRYKRVADVIREALRSNLPGDTFSIQHMYYDVKDGNLCIKEEIDADVFKICIEPIID